MAKRPYHSTASVLRGDFESAASYFRLGIRNLASAQTPLQAYEAVERLRGLLDGVQKRCAGVMTNLVYEVLEGPVEVPAPVRKEKSK